jgi:hypothetical protein
MMQMPNCLHAKLTITAQVLVHPCGIVARVPDLDALAAQLADRTPRRAWCVDGGGTLIALHPWGWLLLDAILERWPDAQLAHVTSLHDRPQPAEGRRAA